MEWWDRMPWSSFSECWASSQLFHSPLSPSNLTYAKVASIRTGHFFKRPLFCQPQTGRDIPHSNTIRSIIVDNSEVAQSCPTLSDPLDCSLPGFSVHGIFQTRVLEWGAISFSRGPSWPRDRTPGLLPCRQTLYHLSHQGSPKQYNIRIIFSSPVFSLKDLTYLNMYKPCIFEHYITYVCKELPLSIINVQANSWIFLNKTSHVLNAQN